MLRSVLVKKVSIVSMSQKLISSFFTSPSSRKRKRDESEDEKLDGRKNAENLKKPSIVANQRAIILGKFLFRERCSYCIYPPENYVYSWTNAVKIQDVKVVILGQDPYHGPNQAHGLAFSVRKGVVVPKSLGNL
ncbi:Uracil-DNA glycosylase like protein [Argiope bruennichi]|uniref:Uracil-DNA glycosylase like protein n=1 Tax=Argiope bruennichi TaxID=94029 RepID=A0A8T0FFQ8_ARGBR|nr:Uracil-DNA glycosylase like protein [Argiope bruennichi]